MPGLTSGRTLGGSSRKRARPESADVDEEIIDSARASSLLKHEPGKRVRVSEAGSHRPVAASCNGHAEPSPGGEGDDDDVDEEEDGDEDARMSQTDVEDSTPPATQYETVRDKGFGHLRHEQEDDFRATQRLMSRDTVGENHTADNGILESVTCINFMCHERLHCDLGPLINFIVGENGSGKSAILTAITLCLGAKASSTNRGGSLKAFIKEGKDQSILTVRIKNQGVDAYMHDVYGDSIIVERHFSRAGGSGFKVKSATGRLISTKKSEVGEVTEYYCLQIDNPLNVLSQDNARQFLNAASDSQKYKFFFEGVQLAQLNTDYRLVAELLDSIESKKHEQTEEVAFRKKVYQDAMRLVESIQQNRELRKKRRLYGQQLAWSQVKDEEDELKRRGREIEKCETRIERVRRAAVRVDKAYADENEKLERMQERLAEMIEMESELISKEEQVTAEWQAAKGAAEKVQYDVRDARSRITRAQQQRDECARKIKEEEERVASMTGDALVTRREKLSQETENLARLRQDIAEGRGQLRELEKEAEARRQEAGRMAESVHRKQGEIKAARDKMSQLQRDDGPQWAAYERNVPRLLDMINKDGRFQEKPVGPLGSLISVANPRWISILEKTFGGTLNAFVVTNKEDQQRLQDMMRRLAIHHCPILVSNRRRINTEPNEPNKEFVTILSILTFADDLVRSQLIINNSIEQIILIEDREEAQEVMFRRRPDKVKACLCFHDSKRGHGLRLTNRSGHQLGTSPITPANGLPRMQAEVQSQIAQQREMLTQLEAELDNIRAEEAQLRRKSNEAQNAIKDHKARQVKLVKDERLLQVVINNLESELDAMDGIDGRLQSLEAEKKQYDGDIETYGNQFGALDVEKKEKFDLVKKLQARRAEAKAERQDHDERRNKHQEKVNMQTDARRLTLVQKNEAHDAIRQAEQAKQTAENEVRQQEKKVEAFTAEAASMVPERVHVPEGETYATIEKKMEALKKQLDDSTKRIGKTDEEVNSEATEAKEAYKQASLALRGSLELSSRLKQSLEVRLEKWRTFQRYISSSARAGFMYLLSERGFRGRLMLDHVNKKLQVQVEPDASRKDAAGRNTKTLSGGEKSFSSICLLLAIWDSMGSPLRCLDEFDVFMDNVNRAISTNMLISAARRSVSRQYIMITPNAIEGRARLEQDVKIIRMTDPRQRTLDDFR